MRCSQSHAESSYNFSILIQNDLRFLLLDISLGRAWNADSLLGLQQTGCYRYRLRAELEGCEDVNLNLLFEVGIG